MSDYPHRNDDSSLPLFNAVRSAVETTPAPVKWERDIQPSINRAERNAADDWRQVAIEGIEHLAKTHFEFTADELVKWLETKPVETHNLSAIGPVFLQARKLGWIESTDRMVQSTIPRRHRKITVWRSLIFQSETKDT